MGTKESEIRECVTVRDCWVEEGMWHRIDCVIPKKLVSSKFALLIDAILEIGQKGKGRE